MPNDHLLSRRAFTVESVMAILATATITKTTVAMTMSETMSVDALCREVCPEWTGVLTPYA